METVLTGAFRGKQALITCGLGFIGAYSARRLVRMQELQEILCRRGVS